MVNSMFLLFFQAHLRRWVDVLVVGGQTKPIRRGEVMDRGYKRCYTFVLGSSSMSSYLGDVPHVTSVII